MALPLNISLAYTLVLFYGMKCLDEQWISGKTLEMKSFDLSASRSCLHPGEEILRENTLVRDWAHVDTWNLGVIMPHGLRVK